MTNMELDQFALLYEGIQKRHFRFGACKVRSGKQVLDELAFKVAAKQGLPEAQDGKALPL